MTTTPIGRASHLSTLQLPQLSHSFDVTTPTTQARAMPPPRTTAFFIHPIPTTGIASPPLHRPCSRSFSSHHGTFYKRPQRPRPRPRHNRHPHPASQSTILFFSTTSARRTRERNYYEILDLPVTATAAEIKKQFYALSLRHHPDRNRTDPTASERFSRISAAYNVLGNAHKRSTYDRDNGFHHAQSRAPGQHPMGSHSSYSANLHHKGGSYAGSRPASGLSNRRGAFRGPPPSFYAQGGYGKTGRTEEGSFTAGAGPANEAASASASGGGSHGAKVKGKGKGWGFDPEDPTGFIDRNPLGHFNARGHFRTQTAEDARRRERRVRARRAAIKEQYLDESSGLGALRFMLVSGILIAASATSLFIWPATTPPTSPTAGTGDGKTSRRRKEVVSAS